MMRTYGLAKRPVLRRSRCQIEHRRLLADLARPKGTAAMRIGDLRDNGLNSSNDPSLSVPYV